MAIRDYKKGSNKRLSTNFSSNELDCKCSDSNCTETLIDDELIKALQKIRDITNKSIQINSGYRCEDHNENIGGSKRSQHKLGTAADIVIKDTVPLLVQLLAEHLIEDGGVGRYDTFTHLDTRGAKARWDFRGK